MKSLRRLLFVLCIAPLPVTAEEPVDQAFDKDVLVIAARDACYRFDIYLALSREQQVRGLMRVRDLPSSTGMLFVYPAEDYHSMWMKNTFLPLDILFATSDGRVSSIAKNTEPQSLKSITSTEPVMFVLELNAGTSDRLAIEPGSRLIWERPLPN
ncbi:MAG: DUF192 domain-containing protein [Woeseiaceae bacterium]